MDLKLITDTDALKFNLSELKKRTSSRICAMVKADAYGHGLVETARLFSSLDNTLMLGAATAEEALIMREAHVKCDILIVGGLQTEYAETLIKQGVICTVLSISDIAVLNAAARKNNNLAYAHMKLDTGMHRLGVSDGTEIKKMLAAFADNTNVILSGVFTHYATGDSGGAYLNYQYDIFNHLLSGIKKAMPAKDYKKLCIHGANTGALLDDKKYHMDMVRTGLFLYGYGQGANGNTADLKPALTASTRIVQISRVKAGEFVGYGNNYRAERDIIIAVIRAGYGDGYKRGLSNKGKVSIKGCLCPVIGNICMDLCMIDVTNVADLRLDDVVYLLNGQVTAKDLAEACGTIPYDILTSFSRRVYRAFI